MRSTPPDMPLPSRILIVPKKNPTATTEGEYVQQCARDGSYPELAELDQATPDTVSISFMKQYDAKQGAHDISHPSSGLRT
jgi:hypothetical protein